MKKEETVIPSLTMLPTLLESYVEAKTKLADAEKRSDELNGSIKSCMKENKLTNYEYNGIKATYSVAKRQSFVEEALLNKVKEMGLLEVVKTKEYVDMELLESAIYEGKINAAELASCQTTKEVVTLRVSQKGAK